MRYNIGSVHTEFLPLGFCISRIGSLKSCFLENYGCHEVDLGVKMTARPFSTIHLLIEQFIESNFIISFHLLYTRGLVLAVFLLEFMGVLVHMVAWGLKKVYKKLHELKL